MSETAVMSGRLRQEKPIPRDEVTGMKSKKVRMPQENTYIIWEDDEKVCLGSGFKNSSHNEKTGGMIQTYFFVKETNPADAVSKGIDSKVCFDCPFAGGQGCYVAIGKAPMGMYRKWKRGGYQHLIDLSLVSGRKFRFGSYGEPILLPIEIVRAIAQASDGWTAYTHQWRNPVNFKYQPYFMASTSDNDDAIAMSYGWRTFCVTDKEDSTKVECPASHEAIYKASMRHAWQSLYGATKQWKQANCQDCGLCSGKTRKTVRGIVANKAPSMPD
jgi:hypothetical protein